MYTSAKFQIFTGKGYLTGLFTYNFESGYIRWLTNFSIFSLFNIPGTRVGSKAMSVEGKRERKTERAKVSVNNGQVNTESPLETE